MSNRNALDYNILVMVKSLVFCALAMLPAPFLFAQSYTISTYAGTDRLLDGHAANAVPLRYPWGMAQDVAGNIYFADDDDNRVRMVDVHGIISTVAGNGVPGFSGDGGKAVSAELNGPQGIRLDGEGICSSPITTTMWFAKWCFLPGSSRRSQVTANFSIRGMAGRQ